MAVPTITSISPATGPATGHNLVTITGTNFKVPTVVYSIPVTEDIPTVGVTVNGVDALAVRVLSATQLEVLVPRYRGSAHAVATGYIVTFPAVNVIVTNLDDDGDPIAGETVASTGGYTYARWNLAPPDKDPPELAVLRRLMEDLLLDITENLGRGASVDFTDDNTAVHQVDAALPYIGVAVSLPKDKEWAYLDNGRHLVEDATGKLWEYDGARTCMLVLDLILVGEGEREAMHLQSRVMDFVHLHPHLEVDADQTLFPGETDEHVLEVSGHPVGGSDPNNANIRAYSMQIRVRGIQVYPDNPREQIYKAATLLWAEMRLVDGESEGTAREITL